MAIKRPLGDQEVSGDKPATKINIIHDSFSNYFSFYYKNWTGTSISK